MARAKQTVRAEARRRFRQSQTELDEEALEPEEGEEPAASSATRASARATSSTRAGAAARDSRPPTGRMGFMSAFRAAYHPANLREDLRLAPRLFRSRAFIAAALMVIGGGLAWYLYPMRTGSSFAWQIFVLPNSALAPQLVAGFFAPRASYILGFVVGIIQPVVYLLVNSSERVQGAFTAANLGDPTAPAPEQLLTVFASSVVLGTLIAAAAAWYRRFLNLSSPRRGAVAGKQPPRTGRGGNAPRRTASR